MSLILSLPWITCTPALPNYPALTPILSTAVPYWLTTFLCIYSIPVCFTLPSARLLQVPFSSLELYLACLFLSALFSPVHFWIFCPVLLKSVFVDPILHLSLLTVVASVPLSPEFTSCCPCLVLFVWTVCKPVLHPLVHRSAAPACRPACLQLGSLSLLGVFNMICDMLIYFSLDQSGGLTDHLQSHAVSVAKNV